MVLLLCVISEHHTKFNFPFPRSLPELLAPHMYSFYAPVAPIQKNHEGQAKYKHLFLTVIVW